MDTPRFLEDLSNRFGLQFMEPYTDEYGLTHYMAVPPEELTYHSHSQKRRTFIRAVQSLYGVSFSEEDDMFRFVV